MSDNNNTSGNNTGNQAQASQQQGQTTVPERVFDQTDTTTNVSMQKGENGGPLTTKETK